MPPLHHQRIAHDRTPPERWLYFLHGIYGSGRNWAAFARRFVDAHPHWGVILVDLRLHGESLDFEPPHTVRAAAEDVRELERALELPATAMLGHSFGGKVALVRASDPGPDLRQVWVIDSTLRAGSPAGSAWRVIEIVRGMPERLDSRDEVVAELQRHGYARAVGQWLAMNLIREGNHFRWKLDWDGVEALLRDYFATDVWPVLEDPPASLDLHIVRAVASDSIDPDSLHRLEEIVARCPRVHLHSIQGGHWVNVENPDALLDLLDQID